MERYRNFVRLEQMKENIRAGKNEEALKLADQLDPAKIKSNSDLGILSDLYLESGMLAKAGKCLSELYNRKKTRSILMQLINLSVRIKKVDEAETYFREFKAMAPDDFYNYIFRYSIDKIKGRDYETLIGSLEKLKEAEYIDSWAYELAKLYHKAGRKDDCIRECDDIVAWFGDGEYVDRARALKAYYLGELNNVMSRPAGERRAETENRDPGAAGQDPERDEETEEAVGENAGESARETAAADESGVVEIIGTVEEAKASLYNEEDGESIYGTDSDGTDSGASDEEESDYEESDYEEDLKEFEQEFNIRLADEVMAQIEGLDESHFEVEPVDISGVMDEEDFREPSDDDVKIAYGRNEKDPGTSGDISPKQESEAIEEEYTSEELEEASADRSESADIQETPTPADDELNEIEAEEPEVLAEPEDNPEAPQNDFEEPCDNAEKSEAGSEEDTADEDPEQNITEEKDAGKEAGLEIPAEELTSEAETEENEQAPAEDEKTEAYTEPEKPESSEIDETPGSDDAADTERSETGFAGESETGSDTDADVSAADGEADRPENDEAEPETASHEFKGPKTVKIAQDSLLAAFLARNGAELGDYFGFFAYQAETRGQLIKTLEILLNPQIRNKCVVVSGERNSGSKTIIKGLTKVLYQSGFLKSPQIAFTESEKINTMKLEKNIDRLIGCCLMINHAGKLSSDSVRQLLEANTRFTGKTAVIMTDTRSGISGLLKENRELNSMFPLRIHIPVYDVEDMEDLLFVRLNEKDYAIEKNAYELMQKELKQIVREVGVGCLAEADRYIETVIDRLETRNARKMLTDGFNGVGAADRIILAKDIRK